MTAVQNIDFYVVQRPLTGKENECGDIGLVINNDDDCLLALVDALGHGKEAHEIACSAVKTISENCHDSLVKLIEKLHANLKYTRGAVAAICRLEKSSGALTYVGVGNINVRIFGGNPRTFVPRDGIIGYMMSTPKEQEIRLVPNDILVMSSDGLKEHFSLYDYPMLLVGTARQIANNMVNFLGKGHDDASCLVLRYAT